METIKQMKRQLMKQYGMLDNIPGYGFRQWPWQRYESIKTTYFDKVQKVIKEYDIELTVNDRRNWRHESADFKAKTIEI